MIDNKELIIPLLNFEKKGDFYMLYIFKRKKDQPEGEKQNNQSVRTINTYCVDSLEYLEKRWDEIVTLSELFKARAYIHVQKQNHFDVGLSMMKELAQRLIDGVHNQKGLFESVVGQLRTHEKRWVLDIDYDQISKRLWKSSVIDFSQNFYSDLNKLQPYGDKVITVIPTKNGFHVIASPFNVMEFRKLYSETEVGIQKHNPTLAYFPNSLET